MDSTMRMCASCRRYMPRSSYSANQFSKGTGESRCAGCVHGPRVDAPLTGEVDSGRYNHSCDAYVPGHELDHPFADGAFRWVAKGSYTSGSREGQACVVKWFKTGAVFEEDYFTLDIKAVNKAAVWRVYEAFGKWAGQRILCEPFIQNYQKFNSNTGWNDDSKAWGEVMQALSHFSYHVTGGQFVLCDLQGGIYQHKAVLSDPVILSRNRDYGVTDLGPDGISSFFSQHCCNNYCRSSWAKPMNPVQIFRPVPGTTMMRHGVPTRRSQPMETFY